MSRSFVFSRWILACFLVIGIWNVCFVPVVSMILWFMVFAFLGAIVFERALRSIRTSACCCWRSAISVCVVHYNIARIMDDLRQFTRSEVLLRERQSVIHERRFWVVFWTNFPFVPGLFQSGIPVVFISIVSHVMFRRLCVLNMTCQKCQGERRNTRRRLDKDTSPDDENARSAERPIEAGTLPD